MEEKETGTDSAIETIFELKDMIQQQSVQMAMLQKSILLLDAKLNKEIFQAMSAHFPKTTMNVIQQPVPAAPKALPIAPQVPVQPPRPPPATPPRQNIKVFGIMHDEKAKPLLDVEVKISDANNKPVKQTRTNRRGEWMSFLPPGRYTAEFIAPGMQPDFRQFDLLPGQSEVDVS